MTKRIVTIMLPGDDPDDCMSREYHNYYEALEFAAGCAEQIDANDWADCVINNDGDVCDALKDWNESQRFANDSGLMGHAVISISSCFDARQIFAACRGDSNWVKQKD